MRGMQDTKTQGNAPSSPIRCFLSFADSRMAGALKRIRQQAEEMDFFDDIRVLNESLLDEDFKNRWSDKLRLGSRGFGYWVWKPYLILTTLESLPEGSLLMYCDAGCHLLPRNRKKLISYFKEVEQDSHGLKAFPSHLGFRPDLEQNWTKGDTLGYFGCQDKAEYTHSAQIEAAVLFIRKCDFTVSFVRQWYKVYEEDFTLVDDTPSKSENMEGFIEHRHDQSIFSLLFKLHGCKTFPPGGSAPYIFTNCIQTRRDKGLGEQEPTTKRVVKAYLNYFIVKLRFRFPAIHAIAVKIRNIIRKR